MEICNGKAVEDRNLRLSRRDDEWDPTKELANLKRKLDVEKADAAAGTTVDAGDALLLGPSIPFSAVAGTAYYLWGRK